MLISMSVFAVVASIGWLLYSLDVLPEMQTITSGIVGNVGGILSVLNLIIYIS